MPDKPTLDGLEESWARVWQDQGTYRFDRTKAREDVYSIDTPPPTVTGALHVGHVFSYTHTDLMARFQRMRGREVFYPMGWDDNGLPTERRVQNYYGVRCDPSLPYDPSTSRRREAGPQAAVPISRRELRRAVRAAPDIDEKAFEALWRHLGLSVDWTHQYTTIGDGPRRLATRVPAQPGPRRGVPGRGSDLWDVTFQTAVAQAELEAASAPAPSTGSPSRADGVAVDIDTRPELIPACVALVATPTTSATSRCSAPRCARRCSASRSRCWPTTLAEPDKGTGIAMVCTFGDLTDVPWWRELDLPGAGDRGATAGWSATPRHGWQRRPRRTPSSPARVRTARAAVVELLRSR